MAGHKRHTEETMFPYPELKEYSMYLAKFKTNSRDSVSVSIYNLSYLGRQLKRMLIDDITKVTTDQLMDAYKRLSEKWGQHQTKTFSIQVRGFFNWAIKERKMHADFIMPFFPNPMRNQRNVPEFVTPDMLFRMRTMDGLPLAAAATFELMISSGIRLQEWRQLRANQLQFDQVPVELSSGNPSKFAGGMLVLKSTEMQLKREKSRVTFFSRFAASILKRYMADMGIKPASNTILFPFHRTEIYDWLYMVKDIFPDFKAKPVENHVSKPYDVKEMDLDDDSPEFLKSMLEKKVAKHNTFMGPVDPRLDKGCEITSKGIHPHRFRNTFTCFHYFRNYYGAQHDLDKLRVMLGHQDMPTTMVYLVQLVAITSMKQWEQVHIGKPTDWSRCTTMRAVS